MRDGSEGCKYVIMDQLKPLEQDLLYLLLLKIQGAFRRKGTLDGSFRMDPFS